MPITQFPPAPSRADPATFANKADAYLSHLESPFVAEANALQTNVNAKEAAATASATAADASATAADASATAAANTANVAAWVSGTTYAVGVNRYDTTDFLTYRRKIAGAGTTRPGLDSTNWQLLTGVGNVSLDGVQTVSNKTLITPDITFGVQVISANATAVRSKTYVLTASLTLTLPASPGAGAWVAFANRSGTATPVIARNGQNIMGLAEDMTLDNNNYFGALVYADATRGWIFQ